MTNRDDIQQDLQALLTAAHPSPAFAASVRRRVAEDGARQSARAAFGWALGGAVCVASLMWALSARPPAAPSVPATPATVSAARVGPQAPAAPTQPRARTDRVQGSGRVRRGPAPARLEAGAATGEAGDSRVLVPDDQRIALVHLLQRLHQGRATVPVSVMPAYDEDGLLVPPEPVVIVLLPSPAPPDLPESDRPGGEKPIRR